jgi:hypothetical protein
VSATLDIDALDYNAAVTGFKRLEARAFDWMVMGSSMMW